MVQSLFVCLFFSDIIQVEVIRSYTAKQPDEMSLQVADVVLVSQHVDGTYPVFWCSLMLFLQLHSLFFYLIFL